MSTKTTAPRTLLLAAGATLAVLVSESALQPQRAAAAAAPVCETRPKPEELRPLLSAARRKQFAKGTLRVISAELDGAVPREAVAFTAQPPGRYDEAPQRQSVVWVFRCMDARWQLVAERSYELGEFESEDYEEYGAPGFKRIKAERLLADRDLLRIEWFNFRAASLSIYRYFDLYTLRSNKLDPVFRCATVSTYANGADRAGRSTERTLEFLNDQLPARISVTMRSQWDPGVDDEDKPPNDGLPAQESRTEIYRYDGTQFVTQRPACNEPFEDD